MDLISRQAAIEKFEPWLKVDGYSEGELNMLKAVLYELRFLPSAQPEKRTEERTETHACDCISRQAAILQLSHNKCGNDENDIAVQHDIETIRKLPPAQPKRGEWKIINLGAVGAFDSCSECKRVVKHKAPFYNYCPNCGVDMRGEKDE